MQLSVQQVPTAQLVVSDLLEGLHQMLVEWRSASTKHGELCVTTVGMNQMQMLYAINWGSSDMVSSCFVQDKSRMGLSV